MQNFINNFGGFIPLSSQQYFYMVPSYFSNPFAYYPLKTSLQIERQNEVLASQTLDVPFQTNQLPIKLEKGTEDLSEGTKQEKGSKGKRGLSQKEDSQQSFNIKVNKNEPSVTYKKKNTQSNIVNQTFSFLNSDRSKKLITRLLKNSQKIEEYYRIMTKIKQLNKKYINRNYLHRLLAFEPSTEFEKAFLKAKVSLLKIEQIRSILRVLTFSFLREQVNTTLMTSGKIYKETLPEHFWRKRQIMTFLFGQSKQ